MIQSHARLRLNISALVRPSSEPGRLCAFRVEEIDIVKAIQRLDDFDEYDRDLTW